MSGKAAARNGDPHVCFRAEGPKPHFGGPVAGGEASVLIEGAEAAVRGTAAVCAVGGVDAIVGGSVSVFFGGAAAARDGDATFHGGMITSGASTVTIGDAPVFNALRTPGPRPRGDLPIEGRALLDTIAGTESAGYNVIYGGETFDDFTDHPRVYLEIKSGPNAGKKSSAAGRYQFLASTWDEQRDKLQLPDFGPASQDRAAWDLAQSYYRRKAKRDLLADLRSDDEERLLQVGSLLASQWTSLPDGIEQAKGNTSASFVKRYRRNLGSGWR